MSRIFKVIMVGALLLLFSQAAVAVSWAAAPQIVTGLNHTLALDDSGTLRAWGANSVGQLGDGSGIGNNLPQPVGSLGEWLKITAGEFHSLGIKADGTLWAWGDNAWGQLGDDTYDLKLSPIQVTIPAGIDDDWKQIAAGEDHSLGIKGVGELWAWGDNFSGQLGDNTDLEKPSPVRIGNDNDWEQVAAGQYYSLAIKKNGTLWAWGYNGSGQLGVTDWVTNDARLAPVQVGSDSDWIKVSTGSAHTLAIKANGTLWAWGDNALGQLGDGTDLMNPVNSTLPKQIGTATWLHVSAGGSHSIGVQTDNSLWTWGSNNSHQLGLTDFTTTDRNVPVQVVGFSDWSKVASALYHSFALNTEGAIYAWGDDGFDVLGGSLMTPTVLPTANGLDISTNYIPSGVVTISGPVSGTVSVDETLTADTSALADADTLGSFSYQWQRGVDIISGAASDTYVLTPTDAGSIISVEVSYTDGASNLEVVTSLATSPVVGTNVAPIITSTAVIAVDEDASYSYTFTATDTDMDTLFLSAQILPSWLTFIPGTGVLSGTPSNAEVGDHNVTLRVNDGTVDVDQVFVITVANTNDAPTIDSTAVLTATQDSAYSYTFAATDIDPGPDTLTLSAPVLPTWLGFDATTGVLSGTPTNAVAGTHSVTLRVNDGTVNVDQSFVVTVMLKDTDGDGVPDDNDAFPLDPAVVANADLNQNGTVETVDALLALQIAVSKTATAENLKYGDVAPFVSGLPAPDGQLNAADALVILRNAVGLLSW